MLVDLSIILLLTPAPVLPHPLLPPSDDDNVDVGLLENPLPARPTHLKRGGGGPEIRRPSGPKDDAVFFVVNMITTLREMAHEAEKSGRKSSRAVDRNWTTHAPTMSEHDDDVGGGRGRGGRGRARGGRGGGGRGRGGRFGGRGHVGSRIKTDRANSNTSSDVANDTSFDDAVIEEHYFSSIDNLQNKEPLTMTGKETEVWLKKALRLVGNEDDGIGDGNCGALPQGVPADIVLNVANTVFASESSTEVDANVTIVDDHVKLEQSPCAKNRVNPSPRRKNDTPSRDAQTQTQQRARSKNKKCSPLTELPKGTSEPTIQGWIGTRSPSEEELLYISSIETADDKSIIDDLYDDEVVVEKIKSPPSHKGQSVKLKNNRTSAKASSSTTQRQEEIHTPKEQQKLKPTADDTIIDDLYDDEVVVEQVNSPPSTKEQPSKQKNEPSSAKASSTNQRQEEKPREIPSRKEQQKLKQQQQKKDRPRKGGCVAVPSPPSSLECAPRPLSSATFCTPSKGQENNCCVQGLTGEAEQLSSQESPSVDALLSSTPSSENHAGRGGGRGGKGRRGGGGRGTPGRGPSLSKDVKPQDPNTDKVVSASSTTDNRTSAADNSTKIDTTTAMKVLVPLQPELSEKDRRVAEKKQKMAAIKERKRAEKIAKRQNSHAAEVVITDKALTEASSVSLPPESDNERLAQVIDAAVAKERRKIEESKKSDKRGSPSTVVNNPVARTTASVPSLEDDGKELRLNQHPKSRTSAKGPLPFFEKLRQKKSPSDKGYNDVKKENENVGGSRNVIIKPTQTPPALAVSSTPSAMKSEDTQNQRKKPSVSFDAAVADRPVKVNDVVDAPLVESDQQLESEKERLARLLREEREKAAIAKDRKKTEKSKKHERWLKEREIEKTRRGEFW